MTLRPEVRVVRIEHGPLNLAATLNRSIARDRPLLRASIDVLWDDPDPAAALSRIEAALAAFSPSFRKHQCRGPAAYHVFPKGWPAAAGGNGGSAARAPGEPAGGDAAPAFDAGLMLAHLIEHAVIDFESAITHETRISGVTCARRVPPGRFDLMIESIDPAVGRLCLALAVLLLPGAADAQPPGPRESDLLAAARLTYRHPGRVWTPPVLARAFDWPIAQATAALTSLRQLGYLAPQAWAMNFSGVSRFRVASPPAPPPCDPGPELL